MLNEDAGLLATNDELRKWLKKLEDNNKQQPQSSARRFSKHISRIESQFLSQSGTVRAARAGVFNYKRRKVRKEEKKGRKVQRTRETQKGTIRWEKLS